MGRLHFCLSFLLRTALCFLFGISACSCSSSIEGDGEGSGARVFDIAVGAEVTLTLDNSSCQTKEPDPSRGCLAANNPFKLDGASVTNGLFTVVSSRLDRGSTVLVTVKAVGAGLAGLSVNTSSVRGEKASDAFILHAHDITHVEEHVYCQWPDPGPAPPTNVHVYPVVKDASFRVDLKAMADTTPLLSGAMELIADRGGLDDVTVDAVDPNRPAGSSGSVSASRFVHAPSTPGTHVWKLVGTRTPPSAITFDVYDPLAVGIDVASTSPKAISVRPAINAIPACVYQGNARASVRVVEGSSCRLVLGDFEIDGPLPVTLRKGGATIEVTGNGGCTIEGTLTSGGNNNGSSGSDRVTFEAKVDDPTTTAIDVGDVLGKAPLEKGGTLDKRGACTRVSSISNGKCEAINAAGFVLPDGDCFTSFDWGFEHWDGTGGRTSAGSTTKPEGRIDAGELAGVGLASELHVSLVFKILLLGVKVLVPNNLKYGLVEPPVLDVKSLGCDSTEDYEALSVQTATAGSHSFHFTADNAVKPLDFTIQFQPVAHATFLKEPTDTRPGVVSDAVTSRFFIASSVPLKVKYTNAGGATLRGIAPIRGTGSNEAAGAKLRGDSAIFTGKTPNTITLASSAAPSTHTLDVVDASAITEIAGVGPQDVTTESASISGEEVCIEPFTKGNGQRIHGTSPVRPRISFDGGSACAAGGGVAPWTASTPDRGKLCLAVDEPTAAPPPTTTTDVKIAWGPTATASWACQKK